MAFQVCCPQATDYVRVDCLGGDLAAMAVAARTEALQSMRHVGCRKLLISFGDDCVFPSMRVTVPFVLDTAERLPDDVSVALVSSPLHVPLAGLVDALLGGYGVDHRLFSDAEAASAWLAGQEHPAGSASQAQPVPGPHAPGVGAQAPRSPAR